jgi:hypothetical protein
VDDVHKLRRATVAPDREPLKHEVEADEFFLGGLRRASRAAGRAARRRSWGFAIEVRGAGSGPLRLQEDASGDSLEAFVKVTTQAGAVVHTDGWSGYHGLRGLGYAHRAQPEGRAAR